MIREICLLLKTQIRFGVSLETWNMGCLTVVLIDLGPFQIDITTSPELSPGELLPRRQKTLLCRSFPKKTSRTRARA